MSLGVTHIRHIDLFSPDRPEQSRFYKEIWGLQQVVEAADAAYLRGFESEFYLLGLHSSSRRGIHHLAFGLERRQHVDRAADALPSAGVELVQQPAALDEPGGGYGLRFIDPDGRCVELSSDV